MKNLLKLSLCALLVAAAASCKKKEEPSTRDRLIGTWREKEYVSDVNGNGLGDDLVVNIDSFQSVIITLKSDGSATHSLLGVPDRTFKWVIIGDYLVSTVDTSSNTSRLSFSNSYAKMTLQYTAMGRIMWTTYTKQ